MEVPGVGEITIKHNLINSMHDGKERLAMTQHLVKIQRNELYVCNKVKRCSHLINTL